MSDYELRQLTIDDASLARYSALLGVTSASTPTDYLRWLYAENPAGRAVGFNAYHGDDLAAHYATIPVEARYEGAQVRGLLSLNTATHPAHQGKGLFTTLATRTYDHAAQSGYDFVVGVANANSTPGFTKKLGFQLVTPLDVLVGMGRVAPSTDTVAFEIAWSEPALRWRIGRPHARYVASTSNGDSIVLTKTKPGILAFLTQAPRDLVMKLPRAPLTQPMRMWIGIDPQLTRKGMLAPLPDRLKPSPLNLIFRDLTGKGRTLSRDTLRFQLRDFDAY